VQQEVVVSRRLDNRSVKIAGAAILGAMAFLLQLYVKFPFPLLPWLVFDFAEIPTVLAFLLFGPVWGLLSSTILWLTMVVRGSSFPPGPYMKLAAIVAMQLGMWLGFILAKKMGSRMSRTFALGIASGLVLRVLVMTPINYTVVGVLFASNFYYNTASKSLSLVGITLGSQGQFIMLMLAFTAVYNALHVILSTVPTVAITKVKPIIGQSWFMQKFKK
jgi:riboflavin transporter FmnP